MAWSRVADDHWKNCKSCHERSGVTRHIVGHEQVRDSYMTICQNCGRETKYACRGKATEVKDG